MKDVLGCDGYNLVQNNGEPAGQTVFHFHMHMIPRYENDGVGLGWKMGTLTDEGPGRDPEEAERGAVVPGPGLTADKGK